MDEPDMGYDKNEYCLSNKTVFDRGQIQPGGKIYFKNAYQYWNHPLWSNMDKLDMAYH